MADGLDEHAFCFDGFRLDLHLRSLHQGGEKIKLTPKPFSTLEFLIRNRHRVVSKQELLEKVWGGQRDVSTVEHAIGQLRRALGGGADETQYIQTVPGQGYRFMAELRPLAASDALPEEQPISRTDGIPKTDPLINTAGVGGVTTHIRRFRPLYISLITLTCLGVIGTGVAHIMVPDQVARVVRSGKRLLAMSDSGRVLWRYTFDAPLWEPPVDELAWRTQIVDLDGDGVPEVLVVVSFGAPGLDGRTELYCFSSLGKVLWHYKPTVDIAFSTRDLNGPWQFIDMLVVRGNHFSSIWVAVVHDVWWPSFIVRLSSTGVASRMFTSSGDIMKLGRVQTKSGSYILAAGVNNEYRRASIAMFLEDGPPSSSPQTEGSAYQCLRGCPNTKPPHYILLPRSELNIGSDAPYNLAIQIHRRPGGITVETHESGDLGPPCAFYDFSEEMKPERVAYGGNYREVHRRYEREGRIHHSYKDCPEPKSLALLRICDGHGIWSTVAVPRVPSLD
jgi:DNA-binding winged helix-turn-helix (wHTH) protein